jgi:alanine racemase
MPAEATLRPVWAEVDLEAVRHNAGVLRRLCAPARLCAVVKADAYGHGAVAVGRAALEGGASWLGVAVVDEGIELRRAGVRAPVLILSETAPEAIPEAVAHGLVLTVYTADGIAAAERAARSAGTSVRVHLKVDTGMHRVGADPDDVRRLAETIRDSAHLELESVWTHLSVADGTTKDDLEFTAAQLGLYEDQLALLAGAGIEVPLRHAGNSAGAIAHPQSHYDMVRCGIALYGELPASQLAPFLERSSESLRPAMSLKARVSFVRELPAGERPSYGRRRPLPEESLVATVPAGYADGIPRAWFDNGGGVLIGGHRYPLAGTVTMDQIVVDCGPPGRQPQVSVGDEVVLIGSQGGASLSAAEWAATLGTISYEVLCGIGPRVPRVYIGAGDRDRGRASGADAVAGGSGRSGPGGEDSGPGRKAGERPEEEHVITTSIGRQK